MSNDDVPRSHAEQTDASTLGETDDIPGDEFPPDRPLGVEDPDIRADGSIAPDDVETRDGRERPEVGDSSEGRPSAEVGHDFLDPSADPDRLDDESELIASRGDEIDSAAEVTAVHEVPDT